MEIRSANRKRQQGLTLIELLLVLAMTAVLGLSLSFAFASEMQTQKREETARTTINQSDRFERQVTLLLMGARFDATASTSSGSNTPVATRTSYFIGVSDGGSAEAGSDRITFTTTALGVPMAAMNNTTDDFTTQQTTRGPIGGLSEVSLGMTPVGAAGAKTGLFERVQRPADGDWNQGGNEFVLDSDIAGIGFQFWDGEEWQDTWDTTMNTVALPQAVQVTYTLASDKLRTRHIFVVPIPASTVNYQNIYITTTSTSATSGGG